MPTLLGPCRLADVTDGEKQKYCEGLSYVSKLQKILADETRYFLLDAKMAYKEQQAPILVASDCGNHSGSKPFLLLLKLVHTESF